MSTELVALPSDSQTHSLLRQLSLSSGIHTGPKEMVRAYDAADEFLLHEFVREKSRVDSSTGNLHVLVVNDRFGALTVALAGEHRVTSYGDSFLAFDATEANLETNHRSATFVTSIESLTDAQINDDDDPINVVIVRLPKSLALLEAQLLEIRRVVRPGTAVICGAMEKHLSRGVNALLDSLIGPAHASLGWRKSRLVIARAEAATLNTERKSPYPLLYVLHEPDTKALQLANHANVFSRNGLDSGTRAMLPYLAQDLGDGIDHGRPLRVADLGCGNGVVGILSALVNPQAEYSFFDESFMAVQSARENWFATFADRPARFEIGNGLPESASRSFDVVLCNPPFHQDHTVGDETAWRMFLSAHQSLANGGSFLVVGNRHLNYHIKLQRLFGSVDQLGGNTKFVVLHARRK